MKELFCWGDGRGRRRFESPTNFNKISACDGNIIACVSVIVELGAMSREEQKRKGTEKSA
jgi:hypothetical protein